MRAQSPLTHIWTRDNFQVFLVGLVSGYPSPSSPFPSPFSPLSSLPSLSLSLPFPSPLSPLFPSKFPLPFSPLYFLPLSSVFLIFPSLPVQFFPSPLFILFLPLPLSYYFSVLSPASFSFLIFFIFSFNLVQFYLCIILFILLIFL